MSKPSDHNLVMGQQLISWYCIKGFLHVWKLSDSMEYATCQVCGLTLAECLREATRGEDALGTWACTGVTR